MASVRPRKRKDGTPYWAVLYRHNGKQTSTSFPNEEQAGRFCKLVDAVGPDKAREAAGLVTEQPMSGLTVTEYLEQHIDSLSGVERRTITDYRRYLRNDISPVFGALPLGKLTRVDVAAWVNTMHADGAKAGTMQNKHGFLSGALKQAVKDGHLPANPCDGVRLPRTEERETVFLTGPEYQILKASFSEHYQPFVEFLVASGCRFNEAAALKPSDVDRVNGTVRIARAWKQDGTRYTMGAPKTKKSNRTISVDKSVLDQLDYSHEWLFTTTQGGPIRLSTWRTNVWNKSRAKAMAKDKNNPDKPVLEKSPTPHDMRHTCASWMLQAQPPVPLQTVQEHLGHESITTTVDRYGHLDRSSHVVASNAIAAMLAV
ncbi:tyrosine-type recombinase/integrase [Mycolicibacterium brisbanense]|uniref:Integrase family protein n=1 Tax=Mycolicibacterium brisbanense TaxID=146020 RepID=A0A100VVN2_9MYCO|nr:site-specific integrase [Mycolicibacterium brisbanense]MCV7157451.1 site-specific integrase [Mycolicibacterium brisbanense]GAS86721.1 integrase family protein [Mycolicibacterium brisbanense]